MATLAESLTSSTSRKLSLRKRPDLIAKRERYQGRSYWIIKDPVGLHYYRFQEEEYFILNLLDGATSLQDIKEAFEAEFPPQKIKFEEVGQYLGTLHKAGLVISDSAGQAFHLLERHSKRRWGEFSSAAMNFLSIRFRGWNPERFLNWLAPRMAWFYHPTTVILALIFITCSSLLVAVNFQDFREKLPTFHQFFTVGNAFWLAVVLAVTKVLHEFGHGLTCKHFGGECHEMGIMFLVFTPCLFCNVSDSWMLPNKWHRAAIGAGGMYVELIIASFATWIWWYTQPGLLHNICLSTMFVSSVSTVVFNGNPLLRYDGYYILADILEIPNLSQKSNEILTRYSGWIFMGLEVPDDPFLPRQHRFLFAVYAVASFVYRWLVVFSILLFMNNAFRPYRLEIIGRSLAVLSLWGMFGMPLWKLGKFLLTPGRSDMVKKANLYPSIAGVALLVLAFMYVPLPHRVHGAFELEPHDAASVFVEVTGQLKALVKPGDYVTQGQPLAILTNDDLEISYYELERQRLDQEARVKGLMQEYLVARNDQAAAQLPSYELALASVREQLKERKIDLDRLVLRAPKDGTVLPPPEMPHRKIEKELPSWHGSPFAPRNERATLSEGTLFCRIGEAYQMEALMVIEQSEIELIQIGQPVELQLDELPGETFHGIVQEKSTYNLHTVPQHLLNKGGGEVASKADESGNERPLITSYQIKVYPIEDKLHVLRTGLRGRAKVSVPWESLSTRFYRWFTETFHFRF